MPDITNPYDAVIADLEAKRAEIDAAVRLMKKLRDRIGMSVADDAGSGWKDEIQLALGAENDIPSDAFFGMTIADAAVKYLGKWTNRKPQSTKAIIEALGRGGLKGKAYPTVYGILNRRKEREASRSKKHQAVKDRDQHKTKPTKHQATKDRDHTRHDAKLGKPKTTVDRHQAKREKKADLKKAKSTKRTHAKAASKDSKTAKKPKALPKQPTRKRRTH